MLGLWRRGWVVFTGVLSSASTSPETTVGTFPNALAKRRLQNLFKSVTETASPDKVRGGCVRLDLDFPKCNETLYFLQGEDWTPKGTRDAQHERDAGDIMGLLAATNLSLSSTSAATCTHTRDGGEPRWRSESDL